MKLAAALVLIMLIIFAGCNKNRSNGVIKRQPGGAQIAELNSYLVEKDRERIKNYAERKNLPLKETGTGLWYMIKNEGSGELLRDKDHIKLEYKCMLLDGTECYSSFKLGPKDLVLGRSEMEAGLNEGLRMMKRGGEAVFVIPPFLAYGLVGDSKLIPPRATLVYEIKVLENKQKE
jgi:FKBP-type peptidyl-prolyl cis-trans isomerase FkpA